MHFFERVEVYFFLTQLQLYGNCISGNVTCLRAKHATTFKVLIRGVMVVHNSNHPNFYTL